MFNMCYTGPSQPAFFLSYSLSRSFTVHSCEYLSLSSDLVGTSVPPDLRHLFFILGSPPLWVSPDQNLTKTVRQDFDQDQHLSGFPGNLSPHWEAGRQWESAELGPPLLGWCKCLACPVNPETCLSSVRVTSVPNITISMRKLVELIRFPEILMARSYDIRHCTNLNGVFKTSSFWIANKELPDTRVYPLTSVKMSAECIK